jgi:hypothetical protein
VIRQWLLKWFGGFQNGQLGAYRSPSENMQERERQLEDYLRLLREMPEEDRSLVLVFAASMRKVALTRIGVDVLRPSAAILALPGISEMLATEAVRSQKQGPVGLGLAGALMVWVHTLRAVRHPSLKPKACEMWRELSKGFPHIETQLQSIIQLTGEVPDGNIAGRFPEGFVPEMTGRDIGGVKWRVSPELRDLYMWQVTRRGWGLGVTCDDCGEERLWDCAVLDERFSRVGIMLLESFAEKARCERCESENMTISPKFPAT